tara:strand:+ start:1246 stop:1425 length:180 start_codon:yes stop_codon:yes gene_type:complete
MDYNHDILSHKEEILLLHNIINKQKEKNNILKNTNAKLTQENTKLRLKIYDNKCKRFNL